MKRPGGRCIALGIAAAGALAIFVAYWNSHWWLSAAGRWLDVGGPPRQADAVVLLNGGENTRPFVAAALVRGGWAAKVILNTVALHPSQKEGMVPPSHEIALRVLDFGQVPPDRLVLLHTSAETTFDEAQGVAAYLAVHPAKRLLLVTNGPHTRRAEWIFHRVLADWRGEILSVSAPAEDFDATTWWRNQEGVLFVVSEYLKLLFYVLRYGWLGYELVTVAATIVILRAWFRRRRKPDLRASVI
jgi:uncharacterized SAM-binding protein YcdF (DUF218 family)